MLGAEENEVAFWYDEKFWNHIAVIIAHNCISVYINRLVHFKVAKMGSFVLNEFCHSIKQNQ